MQPAGHVRVIRIHRHSGTHMLCAFLHHFHQRDLKILPTIAVASQLSEVLFDVFELIIVRVRGLEREYWHTQDPLHNRCDVASLICRQMHHVLLLSIEHKQLEILDLSACRQFKKVFFRQNGAKFDQSARGLLRDLIAYAAKQHTRHVCEGDQLEILRYG